MDQYRDQYGNLGLSLNAVSCPTSTTCLAVGNAGAALLLTVSGTTVTVTNLTGTSGLPTGSLQAVSCDTATTCSAFSYASGAQTANLAPSGTTFSAITSIPSEVSQITSTTCSAAGSCFATGYSDPTGVIGSVVLSTNGIPSITFLPRALIASESYGGPDGSRPCFACALKAAGLSGEGFAAEPINTADGDFYESIPIVSIPGLGPELSYTASYDAQLAQSEVASGLIAPGSLGWGWSSNDSMSLTGLPGEGT